MLGASVRMFIEFINMIHEVDFYEEYVAYLIRINNLKVVRKNRGTIACYERVDAKVLTVETRFQYFKIPPKLMSYSRLTLIL